MTDAVIRADGVAPEPITWLWEEFIPRGMLTLVAGRPDAGKSLFAAWLASDLSKKGHNVIFSNMEDPIPQVVIPRLISLGAKMKFIHFWTPIMPKDTTALAEKVAETNAVAVICDPIAAHITASIYNDQEVRTALSPLSILAWKTKCAVIMVHHTIKNAAPGHAMNSVGGSGGGLIGAARVSFMFGPSPDDEDERVLAPLKFNIGPKPNSVVFEMDEYEWIIGDGKKAKTLNAGRLVLKSTKSKISAEKVLATSSGLSSVKTTDKKAGAAEWLTNYLAYGAMKQQEIAEDSMQAGHTFRTLRRAAEDIEIVKERKGFGKDGFWLWYLPEGHPALLPTCCKKPWMTTNPDLTRVCGNCKFSYGFKDPGGASDATEEA